MCVSNKRLKIEFAATRKTPCNKLSEQDSHPRKSLLNRSVHAEKQQTKKPQRRPQKSTTSWNYAFCWKETASWTAVRNVRPLRNASTQAAAMRSARNGSIKKELDRQFEGQELLYWHDVVLVKRCCAMVITITKLVCLYVIQKTFME